MALGTDDLDILHHAAVFVAKNVAVQHKLAGEVDGQLADSDVTEAAVRWATLANRHLAWDGRHPIPIPRHILRRAGRSALPLGCLVIRRSGLPGYSNTRPDFDWMTGSRLATQSYPPTLEDCTFETAPVDR